MRRPLNGWRGWACWARTHRVHAVHVNEAEIDLLRAGLSRGALFELQPQARLRPRAGVELMRAGVNVGLGYPTVARSNNRLEFWSLKCA